MKPKDMGVTEAGLIRKYWPMLVNANFYQALGKDWVCYFALNSDLPAPKDFITCVNDGNFYHAHHLGPGTLKKILAALDERIKSECAYLDSDV